MKNYIKLLFIFLILPLITVAQEDETTKKKVKEKLERAAFESSYIIDNATNVVLSKKALEVQMAHRFGQFKSKGGNDLAGFWGNSNIRIGLAYGIHERVTLGFGTTKDQRLQDFNYKVALLRQTRSEKMPVSVTLFGNFTVNALKPEGRFYHIQDRWSNFNQIIIARRFTPNLSLQVAPSISHYNMVDLEMRNDMIGIAFGGRYKISPQTSVMVDYSQPLTKFHNHNPEPGISLGVEFATSAHAFQIFASNYWGIVPQQNYMYNQNDFQQIGQYFIGFNITRIYNF